VRRDLNEEGLAADESTAFGVENLRLGPVLAAFTLGAAALNAQRHAGGYWEAIVDLKVTRDGGETEGADGLAHGFVEERSENSAVNVAGRAFKEVGDGDGADDSAVRRAEEVKLEAAGVGRAATEAAVLCSVGQGCEVGGGPSGHAEAPAERGVRGMQAGYRSRERGRRDVATGWCTAWVLQGMKCLRPRVSLRWKSRLRRSGDKIANALY